MLRDAQTRVSPPSTATSPPTESRCSTSKLERRNSLNSRGQVDNVAEFYSLDEIGPHIDQGNSHDAESARKLVWLDAERGLEHLPRARVEHLEEAAIEHDPRGIALTPLDCELFAIGEGRHALGPTTCNGQRYSCRFHHCHAECLPVRTVCSFSSSSGRAIRRPPATASQPVKRGAACAMRVVVQPASGARYRDQPGASRGLPAR